MKYVAQELEFADPMRKIKLSTGDVFSFAKSEHEWGCGQVVLTDIIQYITIFEPVFQNPSVSEAVVSKMLLCGWTMDARFYSGHWSIIGNAPPVELRLPQYKVEISQQLWVTNVEGKPLRSARTDRDKALIFQSSHSPIAYENAFRAYHGDLPWESWFEELLCHHD